LGDPSAGARILIVDDELPMLDYIRIGLRADGFDVITAMDGNGALQQFRESSPDLLILDLMLPDMDGREICRRVRAVSEVPILIVTARDDLNDKVEGLDSGADDYLAKPFRFKELQARVRALLRRARTSDNVTFGDFKLYRRARRLVEDTEVINLTASEFELLDLLLQRPREPFSREQLLQHLWGWKYEGTTNVVDVHISSLRTKLKDRDRRLIRTVRGVGYTLWI
jgi:DNA-binding response OmpR family regulator